MSAKFSASRKRAFLAYLAQTGNQTLSAERAKVSRSWVCLQRSNDAGFDAACREAIAEAKVRLRPSTSLGTNGEGQDSPSTGSGRTGCGASRRPPDAWAYHDGAELVVNGSNSRRVQVRRAKLSQWTARVEERFLAALRATCNVKAACRHVGLWPPSAYSHRGRWPDFAERWDRAIALGTPELEANVHQAFRHFFDREVPAPDVAVHGVSVSGAIRLLEIYQAGKRQRPD